MGRVDLVARREGTFERLHAMKRLLPQYRNDEQLRGMFLEEARLAGLLRHVNIVSVLDVGEDEDGPFLLMDYVEGVSLGEFLKHHAKRAELLPVQTCLKIGAQIAAGLHAAHELRSVSGEPLCLVHRDVSPQNVLLGADGIVRLTDFGIAKALGRATATVAGVLKGKYGYMSPEQLRCEPIDRRSDLFSLGVILHDMLTGESLYRIEGPIGDVERVLNEPPPDVGEARPDVPPEVVDLVMVLLAKDRDQRPGTAHEVQKRLEAILLELQGAEGAIDLGAYITEQFGEGLKAMRNRVALNLAPGSQERAGGTSLGDTVPGSVSGRRRKRARRAVLAAAVGLASAAAVGVALVTRRKPAAVSPVSATTGPAEPLEIALKVDSTPAGAQVEIAGRPAGLTPLLVRLPKSQEAVLLRIFREGHADAHEAVTPNVDQRVRVTLREQPKPTAPVAASAPREVVDKRPSAVSAKKRRASRKTPVRTFQRFEK